MSDYLTIDGWNGRQRIPVNIVGETSEGLKIKPQERIFLPGRGMLPAGDVVIVPKTIVTLNGR